MKKRHTKSFWHRIRFKYKLSFINESTLEEVWSFRLSQLSGIISLGLFALFLIVLTSVIIVKTPIRNYLPGYLDIEVRGEILQNAMKIDSLEEQIAVQARYLKNMTDIISGNISVDSIRQIDSTSYKAENYDILRTERETEFVKQFEEENNLQEKKEDKKK
ncbi:MAG: hypothetical protein LBE91_00930 [Tannerella sp.]|jgi:hypothetical protein|nr:hypothetical protein [Tannerella sp.]